MNQYELATFKRVIQMLNLEGKTHLTRNEIERVIQELNLSREYKIADYIRAADPAVVATLLR